MSDEFITPESMEEEGKDNKLWIIIAVVALVLICCCCVIAVGAWQFGDAFLDLLNF
jgi:hypothetical protein